MRFRREIPFFQKQISEAGKRRRTGEPKLFLQSETFLDLFGLETIDDLPQTYDHEKIA